MPITYEIRPRVVVFRTNGEVDFAEGIQTLSAALRTAASQMEHGRWHLFFDIQHSSEHRNSSETQDIADTILGFRQSLSGRCAVIAADPLRYGMARMFGAFMDSQGFEVFVSMDRCEAEAWLAAPPAENQPPSPA